MIALSMRVILTLAILAALLVPTTLASPVVDQVKNGGFESWTKTGNTTYSADSWTVVVGTVTRSTYASSGNFSAQLRAMPNNVGGHFSILAQTIPQSQTDLPIVPGAFYDLSFAAAGTYDGKGHGNATVTWVGALGHKLRVDTINVPEGAAFNTDNAHLQAPIDPITGDAATSATIAFVVDGQSSDQGVNLWVDDVQFGVGSPA